jgi:N utilization substance protein B
VQLLYAWETRGRRDLAETVLGLARLLGPDPALLGGSEELARTVVERQDQIDRVIAEAAEHWRIERMGRLERVILRLAVVELLDPAVPPKTAIDEALWLTHRFAGGAAVPFVNGVLDRIARMLGRL